MTSTLPETSPLGEFIAALGKLRLPREFVPIEPNAKQDYFLRRNELEVFFGGAAGPGKVLRVDEPVPTPKGWTTMGALEPGDIVFAADGTPTVVCAVSVVDPCPVAYRLTFDDGTTIEAGADHLWLTFDANELAQLTRRDPEWRARRRATRPSRAAAVLTKPRVSELTMERNLTDNQAVTLPAPTGNVRTTAEIAETLLTPRGRLNHAIPVTAPLNLPHVDLPLDPYLLGVWLGDGSSGGGGVTSADPEVFSAFTTAGFNLGASNRYTTTVLGLRTVLRRLGVLGNKHIPAAYQRASVEQRLALLQGLMDTDGSADRVGGDVEFTSTNPILVHDVHELIVGLGQKARVAEGRATINGEDRGPKWRINWAASMPVFRIPRKLDRQKIASRRTTRYRYVVACDPCPATPMRCIRVGHPSSLFLAGRRMIPTHNSWGLMMAALQWVDSPSYHGLLLRPSATDFEGAKGLIETSTHWLERTKASWNGNRREWTFPSGATVRFGYLGKLADVARYAGHGYSFLGWDELTLFTEDRYRAMMRVVRQDIDTARIGIPIRVRGASNPGNVGHKWVKDRFVDPGTREKGSVYVPATIHDNPDLDYDAYLKTLTHLSPIDQERLIRGDWDVMEKGGKFDRDDFIIIDRDEMPTPVKSVRYWDLAATEPSDDNPDPDWTAGVRLDLTREGEFVISDIRAFRCNDAEVEKRIRQVANEDGKRVPIYIEQEPGASGKPVSDNTPVLMADGRYRLLRDIAVGDRVIGHDGAAHAVTAVHLQGVLPTVKVTTFSGRIVEAALDHPFLTPHGWVNASSLAVGSSVALVSRPSIEPTVAALPEEYRLAGYFIRDGACGPSGTSIACFDAIELADIEHCAGTLGFSMKAGRAGQLHLSGGVKDWLRSRDLAGKRAFDKVVPDWIMSSSPELAAEFIGAYFACDGHVTRGRNGRGLEFYSISRELLVGVQRLLLRLGVNSRVKVKVGDCKGERHLSYRLSLLANDDAQARFAQRVPVPGEKARWLDDFQRSRFDERLIADPVTGIAGGEATCRCLTVADAHTFAADDIVVHNSLIGHYIRNVVPGFPVYRGLPRLNGRPAAKEVRARPAAAAVSNGIVKIVRGPNTRMFLDQAVLFPKPGVHDDLIDAFSGAHTALAKQPSAAGAKSSVPRGSIPGINARGRR